MKNLLLLLLSINGFAQAPEIEWQKSYGGSGYDNLGASIKTTDGGYILAGYSNSIDGDVIGNDGGTDFWFIKLNAEGNIEWQRTFGGTQSDVCNAIRQTPDGGFIAAGYTYSSQSGDITNNYGIMDVWIVKLAADGSLLWQKTYGGSSEETANDIQLTSDGGYIFTGNTFSNNGNVSGNHGNFDNWVVKLDAAGAVEWSKTLGGSNGETMFSIVQTNDGGFIEVGITESNNGNVIGNHGAGDIWIVKLTALGNISWSKLIGGSGYDSAYNIIQTQDGGFIISGVTVSPDGDAIGNGINTINSWIIKLSGTGQVLWKKFLLNYGCNSAHETQELSNGDFLIIGREENNTADGINNFGSSDFWVGKMNASGTLLWHKTLGGSLSDLSGSASIASDGGIFISGISHSNDFNVSGNHGDRDVWAVKLYPESMATENFKQESLLLFPNPTSCILNLQVADEFMIEKVIITDISGKTALQQTQNLNQINTQTLASGIYFLQATSNNKTYQTKFIKN